MQWTVIIDSDKEGARGKGLSYVSIWRSVARVGVVASGNVMV